MTVSTAQPLPNATFVQSLRRFVEKGLSFGGRASPSEYWWVILALVVVSILTMPSGFDNAFRIIVIVPFLALLCRRIRDTGFPVAYVVFLIIPFIGPLIVLAITLLPSNKNSVPRE